MMEKGKAMVGGLVNPVGYSRKKKSVSKMYDDYNDGRTT